MNYNDAGVSILNADRLIDRIKWLSNKQQVVSGIGGFCSLYDMVGTNKLIAATTDGIGTKILLADRYKSILDRTYLSNLGQDLVAMNVNDLITCGADPAFFLDYYATGSLQVDDAAAFINGINEACEISGCVLIGGETSEMPGMLDGSKFDAAGFCVGFVDKNKVIHKGLVKEGDLVYGLMSSGPHSNGFSLIRKIYENYTLTESSVLDSLLRPTKLYTGAIRRLLITSFDDIHGMAHITGGGIIDNIRRVIPNGLEAIIDWSSWKRPSIFSHIQEIGRVEEDEMRKVFNCGIGFVIIGTPAIENELNNINEDFTIIGEIRKEKDYE